MATDILMKQEDAVEEPKPAPNPRRAMFKLLVAVAAVVALLAACTDAHAVANAVPALSTFAPSAPHPGWRVWTDATDAWQVRGEVYGSDELTEALADGWEPFAATNVVLPNYDTWAMEITHYVWLRKVDTP